MKKKKNISYSHCLWYLIEFENKTLFLKKQGPSDTEQGVIKLKWHERLFQGDEVSYFPKVLYKLLKEKVSQ